MKKIIHSAILISMISTCFAQSEEKKPAGVDKSDFIEKIDRSELQSGQPDDINHIDTNFEIPDIGIVKKKKATPTTKSKIETKAKPTQVVVNKTPKQTTNDVVIPKVVIVTEPMTLKALANNDKIVLSNDRLYVYRLTGSVINQYQYNGELPMDSKALKSSGSNEYYIIDKNQFVIDALAKSQAANEVAEETNDTQNEPVDNSQKYEVTQKERVARKRVESRVNRGFRIRNTLELNDLKKGDEINVFGETKLVTRKNENSFTKKFWLMGKFDSSASFIEEVSKYKFRVLLDQ